MSTNNDSHQISNISNWYAGKNIFITGSTGFMGKVLVEKLLRSCQDLKCLYLLIREKKGASVIERKEQYFKCVIFDGILKTNPDVINKVKVIKGDVLEKNLGICDSDLQELISKVDIVFHCAANVRFDQPLRPMIEMNVGGTQKVLQLAEKLNNLKVLIHVSTSYCQCNQDVLEEKAYRPPNNSYEILEMVETLNDKALEQITPGLLNGLPNTYAYSKALTEGLVCSYESKLPIVVCRPSIVTASRKEPVPGWIQGVNGPTGLMIAAARGVLRSMHCNPDFPATIIPVDTAINALIAAAWDYGNRSENGVSFINVCVSNKLLMTWGESIESGKRFFYETPLSLSLWYPNGSIKKNYYEHLFCVIFFHYLPAYFIDFFLFLFGQKPFLVNVQKKISGGLGLLQYYTTKTWEFRNEAFCKLNSKLNNVDQEIFDICQEQINWEQYIRAYIHGMRTFMLNETEASLPKAKKLLRRLYILDRIAKCIFFGIIFTLLWMNVDTMMERGDAIIKNSLNLFIKNENNTLLINK
ncbi:putative fatty acyl-CoA reductase CG5065 [Episyrphus balteatus]|uniref:putative fatty acyl-CoA reductase CG5065 n=1 Tax=Episyrphus balteatus TaxID=286459 RepID=UPI0024856F91|nr:putative fatty acyl-CoA reductase CG5065 [Episyrphus balteatus]XP_055849111.1 putative fatty acyl-CoA reductase CG5065 [Episyrphus balteatus]XP_055849112.1 putative fatty acyl-CoA reductase CG5065 [Episyrphus balteatus]XP_055849113.1 putative fatty acyl-CoA reductase CG5065 [Episyrphus balteatus]XP_055849114.1 putative fatty acyl-CoA reductase CG5065 [Episyrphus balteatus]XP_055849115.1 putative fatty acyl-CoA reductase CG5065 [Episyrphus balteatus]XP_055849116.1 putative fatty acyl-CoA re